MNILVIGSGGREHALVWKIAQSPRVSKIYCIPGNPGMADLAECCNVPLSAGFSQLTEWALDHQIDLTFVGPEIPLVDGIVDAFEMAELRVFGPNQDASQMEGNKIFSKDFMLKNGIPTGSAEYFTESAPALAHLKTLRAPYVIKAFGLAAGKGVVVAQTWEEAEAAIHENLDQGIFGQASRQILIEEYLEGEEASMLAFTDGTTVLPMSSAQDHKAAYDGDKGPNTGGMGAYSPAPVVTPALEHEIFDTILQPTIEGLRKMGIVYKGVLYAGLMIGPDGRPRVIEFNCRFGDPETQPLLMRLNSDLIDIAEACIDGRLHELSLDWAPDPTVCVVMASGGYPGDYEKGKTITGLSEAASADTVVFHAGTALKDGHIVTNGGRVLGITSKAPTLKEAIARAYDACGKITFEGAHYRSDIGQKALKRA